VRGERGKRGCRKPLRAGVKEKESKGFEEAWISKLKKDPEDVTDLEAWQDCERWDEI